MNKDYPFLKLTALLTKRENYPPWLSKGETGCQ